MKAIRKEDGKEIEVQLYTEKQYIEIEAEEGERGRRIYLEGSLIIKEAVDWEAFRREAAKDVLPAVIAKKSSMCSFEEVVKEAVQFADELIKKLKDGK